MKALADIYFYDALSLASELREGTVSEARAVKHLVATIILGGIGFEVPVSIEFQSPTSGFGHTISYIALFIITGVISYYGVWLTHQVNGKGDGKDYFLRFVALTLPVGIQLVVLFLGVGLFLVLLALTLTTAFGEWVVHLTDGAFYIAVIAFTVMFFLRMRRYIGVASGYER